MKTADLKFHIIFYAEFGKHSMDKLLLCVQNLSKEHQPFRPPLVTNNSAERLF